MPTRPVQILAGLAALAACAGAGAPSIAAAAPPTLRLAQNADPQNQTANPVAPPQPSDTTTSGAPPSPPPPVLPSMAMPGTTPGTTAPAPATTATAPTAPPATPALTGSQRNAPAALPSMAQPMGGPPQSGTSASIPFGGPQTTNGPVYGSTLRDPGTGIDGTPIYSTSPTTLGGPINGTGNAYTSTLPDGSQPNGYQATTTQRNPATDTNPSGFNQQPLGGRPNTRDQFGTFGARGGYNAQGVYTGTAAQPSNGYGYGSAYATVGRPTGGLLGTNVDATGPLRPYVPQDNGTIGRPNSGYGVPNGSRPTRMDARGIQRIN